MRVALTGGICSGKSAAAALFRAKGCRVSQSDEVARTMMQPGEALFAPIVAAFGTSVLDQAGSIDRAELARVVFGDGRLRELEAIVHPAVITAQNEWMRGVEAERSDAIAMVESALVLETQYGPAGESPGVPWRTRFDRLIVVTAPDALRLERYFARVHASTPEERGRAATDARARMAAQMPQAEKAALADEVICNDGDLNALALAVEHVWQRLQAAAADAAAEAM